VIMGWISSLTKIPGFFLELGFVGISLCVRVVLASLRLNLVSYKRSIDGYDMCKRCFLLRIVYTHGTENSDLQKNGPTHNNVSSPIALVVKQQTLG